MQKVYSSSLLAYLEWQNSKGKSWKELAEEHELNYDTLRVKMSTYRKKKKNLNLPKVESMAAEVIEALDDCPTAEVMVFLALIDSYLRGRRKLT